MTTDDHGQPQEQEGNHKQDSRTTTDAADVEQQQQTISVNTQQAAQQLGVDSRTVRRYIKDGIRLANGATLRLEARQVRSNRGPEWQIYQTDLDDFKEQRDRAATEGNPAGQGQGQQAIQPVEESRSQSQALTTSINIIAEELERRSVALQQAQETIERLSYEAGRQAGRSEQLERELETMRKRVADLEQERNHWQQQAQERPPAPAKIPRRIRLLNWRRDE
jgi:hypothetical protein